MTAGEDGVGLRAGQLVPTFESMFVAEFPAMVALAAAVSGSRTQAEDIAQDAMLRLHRSWADVSTYERPGAWLRRVTVNLALSHRRRLVSEAKAIVGLGPPAPALPPSSSVDEPVWELVRRLPGRQRAVVALVHLEGHTADEVADILGISGATARVHLHRARRSLRVGLEQHEEAGRDG